MRIPLTQNKFAEVDAADYDWLSLFKWYAEKHRHTFYARTSINGRAVRMHSYITDAPTGADTDHIDHNGLNNHRLNLRVCSRTQNLQNQKRSVGSSKYKGLYRKPDGLWCARIRIDGTTKNLGSYDNEDYAARIYNAAAERLFGEYAHLNTITKKGETPLLWES